MTVTAFWPGVKAVNGALQLAYRRRGVGPSSGLHPHDLLKASTALLRTAMVSCVARAASVAAIV